MRSDSRFVSESPTPVPSTSCTKDSLKTKTISKQKHKLKLIDLVKNARSGVADSSYTKKTWKCCSGDSVGHIQPEGRWRNLVFFSGSPTQVPALALKNVTSSWKPFQNKNIEVKTQRFDRYQFRSGLSDSSFTNKHGSGVPVICWPHSAWTKMTGIWVCFWISDSSSTQHWLRIKHRHLKTISKQKH